jgi:hypothetical protein
MLIMTIAQVPNILGRATEHELAPHLVLEVLLLMVVANAPVVILLTQLLAVVVTIGQMTHDSELIAMFGGLLAAPAARRRRRIFRPLVASLAVITHDLAPRAYREVVRLGPTPRAIS